MPEVTRLVVSPAIVLSVQDGDTITVGNRSFVGPVRLAKVLAMEGGTVGGKKAKEHLQRLLPLGGGVRVQLAYTKSGNAVQSLCRPIADVWVEATGVHVNEAQMKYLKANRLWGGTGKKRNPENL